MILWESFRKELEFGLGQICNLIHFQWPMHMEKNESQIPTSYNTEKFIHMT